MNTFNLYILKNEKYYLYLLHNLKSMPMKRFLLHLLTIVVTISFVGCSSELDNESLNEMDNRMLHLSNSEILKILQDKNNYDIYTNILEKHEGSYIPVSKLQEITPLSFNDNGIEKRYIDDEDILNVLFNKNGFLRINNYIFFNDVENNCMKSVDYSTYKKFNWKEYENIFKDDNCISIIKFNDIPHSRMRIPGTCGVCGLAAVCLATGILPAFGLFEIATCVDCYINLK